MTQIDLRLRRDDVVWVWLLVALVSSAGCGPKTGQSRYKETTSAFVGAVVQNGKSISLPDGSRLDLVHDKTYSKFGIPLKQDGTFTIGWMPTGKYSGELVWLKQPTKEQPDGCRGNTSCPAA